LQAASAKEEEQEVKKEGAADAGAEIDPASQRSDLLSLLLKSRAEDARHNLTDEEIFSDSFIFLLAGHEVRYNELIIIIIIIVIFFFRGLTRSFLCFSCRPRLIRRPGRSLCWPPTPANRNAYVRVSCRVCRLS